MRVTPTSVLQLNIGCPPTAGRYPFKDARRSRKGYIRLYDWIHPFLVNKLRSLKARGAFFRNIEGGLKSHPDLAQGAFIKEPAD